MVTQQVPGTDTGENPILTEITQLNDAAGLEPVEPGNIEEEAPAPLAEEPVAEAPPVDPVQGSLPLPGGEPVAPAPAEMPAPPPQQSEQEMQALREQAQQYQQVQERAALQQESAKYQQQQENQGYLPEQAQQISHQYMQSRQAQQQLVKQANEYGEFLLAKQAASEHFAQKYKLQMNDLATLRVSETPEQMESVAKKIAEDRQKDSELARLRESQVPAQQFDNSQGSPEVAASEGSWLDRYNSGDRSANAVAAARRAAGLE